MRRIADITIEEVVELLKSIDRYRKDKQYYLQLLPIGDSIENRGIEKWVRVFYKVKTMGCRCCANNYDGTADKIIMNIRDDEKVVYFVEGGGANDKTLKKLREHLVKKGFNLKSEINDIT